MSAVASQTLADKQSIRLTTEQSGWVAEFARKKNMAESEVIRSCIQQAMDGGEFRTMVEDMRALKLELRELVGEEHENMTALVSMAESVIARDEAVKAFMTQIAGVLEKAFDLN